MQPNKDTWTYIWLGALVAIASGLLLLAWATRGGDGWATGTVVFVSLFGLAGLTSMLLGMLAVYREQQKHSARD
jgi:uncharacterized membrane protein